MQKKYWIGVFAALAMSVVVVAIGSFIHQTNSGEHFGWQLWVFVPLGVTALALGVALLFNYLETHKGESFESQLSRIGVNTRKTYVGHHIAPENKVCVVIDFDSKQFASNLIYHYVVPFSRIASGRIEVLPYATSREKCRVQYVISVRRKDNETNYDYIELFDTVVYKSELGENDQLTTEMFNKYPVLNDILALNEDVQKIMEINIKDGVALRDVTDDE